MIRKTSCCILKTILAFMLTCCHYSLGAQQNPEFRTAISNSFAAYYSQGTHEKVYVHTDREVYSAGDTLWFKAYVTEGLTDLPLSDSRFVYVELRGPGAWHKDNAKVYERIKARKHLDADSTERFSIYDNRIEIPESATPGIYTLHGYTQWMYNHPTDYMFTKRIEIRHPDENYAVEKVKYTRLDNGQIAADIQIVSSQGTPLTSGHADIEMVIDGKLRTRSYSLRQEGRFRTTFDAPTTEGGFIDITYDSPEIPAYRRRIELPSFRNDFDVAFLPEGGRLIAGIPQRIAFKAVGVDGLATEVKGTIHNSAGEVVCDIESTHRGMGLFLLTPVADEQYTALLHSQEDTLVAKSFTLPAIDKSGCTLAVDTGNGSATCRVLTTPDIDPSKIGTIIHSKGEVCHIGESAQSIKISTAAFNNGIATISLVDKQTLQPLCDRSFFIWNGEESSANISANKASYKPYSLVELAIQICNKKGEPITDGSYSLSVVDKANYTQPQTSIHAATLLTSDLKGYIENPAYYFENTDRRKLAQLDLVMMTHGWHRFELDSILMGNIRKYTYGHESVHTISGHLEGLGASSKNAYIAIMEPLHRASGRGFYKLYNLGEDPSFEFAVENAPRGMYYILQAWTKIGSKFGNTIELDPEIYPDFGKRKSLVRYDFERKSDSVKIAELNVTFDTTDISRIVQIEAVAFNAGIKRENYIPSESMSKVQIEERKYETLGDVLDDFPGIYRMRSPEYGTVYLTAKESGVTARADSADTSGLTPIKICVDGDPYVNLDHLDVEYIPLHAVKYVDYVGYPQCKDIFFSDYPVINIGMPVLYAFTSQKKGAITVVKKLGYSPDTTFYAPIYAPGTRGVIDKRKTIHWEPNISPDSTGMAHISFFTADKPSTYTITIEGVSNRGELCSSTSAIEVKP